MGAKIKTWRLSEILHWTTPVRDCRHFPIKESFLVVFIDIDETRTIGGVFMAGRLRQTRKQHLSRHCSAQSS
jgi:hypothetical protein